MATQRKPARQPATLRGGASRVGEDPLQHLWAVSYTDLLMVMLSFFVIFFNMSDVAGPNAMEDIVVALSGNAGSRRVATGAGGEASGSCTVGEGGSGAGTNCGAGVGASEGAGPGTGSGVRGGSTDKTGTGYPGTGGLAALIDLPGIGRERDREGSGLVLHFPANSYQTGKFAIQGKLRDEVEYVLDRIKPYAGKISLTFVGHTDAQPVLAQKGQLLDSNLVLSNLRASRATEFAMEKGFDPKWLVAQGSGEHSRATRSLSLRITERKVR